MEVSLLVEETRVPEITNDLLKVIDYYYWLICVSALGHLIYCVAKLFDLVI
jgi:hypothetical protein